jgi:hypothetical protein
MAGEKAKRGNGEKENLQTNKFPSFYPFTLFAVSPLLSEANP